MYLKKVWRALKETFSGFFDENILKLSASLSYSTVFAIGPLLLIIVSVIGFFFGDRESAQDKILSQISGLVGESVTTQLDQILNSFSNGDNGLFGLITGGVVLIIGATSVFIDMKDSLNTLWHVRTKAGGMWLKLLFNRLLSFSLVVSMGFLLLVSLVISAFLDILSNKLENIFSDGLVMLFTLLNYMLIILITGGLFMAIFKVLPDAHICWKDAAAGSLFTAILFVIGKYLITLYIRNSSLAITYGAAASIIILLAWVYYSSAILYLGATFTRHYALIIGKGIKPKENAELVREEVVPDE